MATVSRLVGRGDGSCPRCEQFGRTCPSCTQRRRVAWRLVDQQGHTIEQAAARLPGGDNPLRAAVWEFL